MAKNIIIIYGILKKIAITESSFAFPLLINNTGFIAVSSNEKVTRNAHHIDIRYHHIWNLIQKGLIKVTHVSSNQIAADSFTKALPEPKFKEFRDLIGMSGQIEPETDGGDRLEED